jgi:hypothetical protein
MMEGEHMMEQKVNAMKNKGAMKDAGAMKDSGAMKDQSAMKDSGAMKDNGAMKIEIPFLARAALDCNGSADSGNDSRIKSLKSVAIAKYKTK